MVLTGALVGLGFLTKQLQVLLVVPGFALGLPGRRPGHDRAGASAASCVAGAAIVVSAGWWIAIVELVPAGWRPYIGGSQTNSFLELTFGYNGLGRLTGNETGSVGGGGAAPARHVGHDRPHPHVRRRQRRPDRVAPPCRARPARHRPVAHAGAGPAPTATRAALIVLRRLAARHRPRVQPHGRASIHDYYTVALAPAIAGARRDRRPRAVDATGRTLAAIVTMVARRAPAPRCGRPRLSAAARWEPWLGDSCSSAASLAAVGIACGAVARHRGARRRGRRGGRGRPRGPRGLVARDGAAAATRARIVTAGPAVAGQRLRSGAAAASAASAAGPGGTGAPRRADGATSPAAAGRTSRRRPAGRSRRHGPAGAAAAPRRQPRADRPRRWFGGGHRRAARRPSVPTRARRACSDGRATPTAGSPATVGANNAAGYQLATEELGDADRRLQRHGPVADARAVPGVGGRRRRSTTSSAAALGGRGQRAAATSPARSRRWVESTFTATDGRRRHALRPDRREHGVDAWRRSSSSTSQPRRAAAAPVDDRDPGVQRGARARGQRPPAARYLTEHLPMAVADHDRRQRLHGRHAASWRRALAARPAGRATPSTSTARAAGWRCARRGPQATRPSSPTWTSTCPPTSARCSPGRPAAHRPLRRRHRLPPGPRVARRPRPEARAHLARYNLLLRTVFATRFRDAQCGFKAVRADVARALLPAGRGRRLVLRHRAAAARRAQRPAHPRGAGRLGRRPRQPRATSCAPPWTTSGASPAWRPGSPGARDPSPCPGPPGPRSCAPTASGSPPAGSPPRPSSSAPSPSSPPSAPTPRQPEGKVLQEPKHFALLFDVGLGLVRRRRLGGVVEGVADLPGGPEVGVATTGREQLGVGADLGDGAGVDDDDAVGGGRERRAGERWRSPCGRGGPPPVGARARRRPPRRGPR